MAATDAMPANINWDQTARTITNPHVKELRQVLAILKKFGSNLVKETKPPNWKHINLSKPFFRKSVPRDSMFELLTAGLRQFGYKAMSPTVMLFQGDRVNVHVVNDYLKAVDDALNTLETRGSGANQEKRRELKMCAICKRSHALLTCHECGDMMMCQPCERQRHETLQHRAELIDGNKGVIQLLLQSVRNKELSQKAALVDKPDPRAVVFDGPADVRKNLPQPKPDEPMDDEVDSIWESDGPGETAAAAKPHGPSPPLRKDPFPITAPAAAAYIPPRMNYGAGVHIGDSMNLTSIGPPLIAGDDLRSEDLYSTMKFSLPPETYPRKEAWPPGPSAMKPLMPQEGNTELQQQIEKKEHERKMLSDKLSEVLANDLGLYMRLLDRSEHLKQEIDELKKKKQQQEREQPPRVNTFAATTAQPPDMIQRELEESMREYERIGQLLPTLVKTNVHAYDTYLDRRKQLSAHINKLIEKRGITELISPLSAPVVSRPRQFEAPRYAGSWCEECGNVQSLHSGVICEHCQALLPAAAANGRMDWASPPKPAEPCFEPMDQSSPFMHRQAAFLPQVLEPESEPSKRMRASASGDLATWSCQFCTFHNNPATHICEMCAKSKDLMPEIINEPPVVSAPVSLVAPRRVEESDQTMIETLQLIDQNEPKLTDLYARAIKVCLAAVNPKKKLEAVDGILTQFRNRAPMGISKTEMLTSYIQANGDSQRAYNLLLETRAEKVAEFSAQYPDVPVEAIHQLLTECDGDVRDAMNKYTMDDLAEEDDDEFLSVSKEMGPEIRIRLQWILKHDKHMANSEVELIFKLIHASPVELTIDEVIDIARNSNFDFERGKELLNHECTLCYSMFPYTRIRTLFSCQCNLCLECFTCWLENVIREKNVRQWACPCCFKPDLSNFEDASMHYQLLDTVVKQLLPALYEMFTNKLFDYAICDDPNFRYCAHCDRGFVNQANLQYKIRCPHCSKDMCHSCKIQWRDQHDGVTCADFERWEKENNPDYQKKHLEDIIDQTGIRCPKCNYQFQMAVGGCAHFTCSQCKFQFCEGCNHEMITKGKSSPQCNERCATKGLHAHHPRHCLTLTRDYKQEDLEKLLNMHKVPFEKTNLPGVAACTAIVQAEVTMPDNSKRLVDGHCAKAVTGNQAGLCEKHYKLKLCKLIYKSKLDPVDIMEDYEIIAWFQGEYPSIEFPKERPALIMFMKANYPVK